jgi:potassium-transporting ATPase potassium-binding subunit
MMWQAFVQISLILLILIAMSPFLGRYIAHVFQAKHTWLAQFILPLEQFIYALGGLRYQDSMTGWQYARAVLYSNLVMGVLVYLIFLFQAVLPLNPTDLSAPSWDLALHTAISFTTNTNQQHYSGETTFSYASQVLALGYLMFTSAATGIAVAIAFIRGLTGQPHHCLCDRATGISHFRAFCLPVCRNFSTGAILMSFTRETTRAVRMTLVLWYSPLCFIRC